MPLSDEKKLRIEEEERIRAEAKAKYEAEARTKYGADMPSPSPKTTNRPRIQCVKCGYMGAGLSGRNKLSLLSALLCIFFSPLITVIYFLATDPWLCPKCKSKFVEEIDEEGRIVKRRNKKVVLVIIIVIAAIAIISILATIVLVALGSAREKARDARRQSDIRQIALAMEMYYDDNNNQYVTSPFGTPIPTKVRTALSPYFEVPYDPLGGLYEYAWVDNTTGCDKPSQCYCVYATLESEYDPSIFATGREGTALLDGIPTSPLCFESID